ncbi:MAG: hypothetical protein IKF38_01630 [Clostridia bacterium]|nr:hypothetical protein [Clostridia bacterium]
MNRKKIIIPIIILTAIIILLIILLNPSKQYKKLSINESSWNEIISTRTANERLALLDIEFNDYNLIIDKNSSTLYYSAVNGSKYKYNPNVSFKATGKNVKIAILSDEITDEKVQSNYKFKIMIYNDIEYHIYNLVCTDLPILNFNYKETVGNKLKNIPMEMYLFDNLSNAVNRITVSSGKLKINQDNYIFSLNMLTPGKNVRENNKSLLNMKPNNEYILTAINDRNETMQPARTPYSQRVEVFINNEYKGKYLLEHMQEREIKQ